MMTQAPAFVIFHAPGIPRRLPHEQPINRNHASDTLLSFATSQPGRRPAPLYSQDMSMKKPTTHADVAESYKLMTENSELPPGSSFTVRPGPIKYFQLALFSIGEFLIIGRWLPDPEDGFDRILQPRRLIRITGKVPFKIVGAIVPDPETAGWPSVEIAL